MRSSHVVVVLGVLLAFAVGLTLWSRSDEGLAPSTTTEPTPVSIAGHADATSDIALPHESVHTSRTEATASTPMVDAPPLDILVVDAATGTPQGDVEVVFDDGSARARVDAMPEDERGRLAYDAELRARTFGGATRTGADGVARVHRGPRGTTVHARSGDLYDMTWCSPSAEGPPTRHRLALAPDFGFVVRIVDASGAPAIGVATNFTELGPDGARRHPSSFARPRLSRAPDGVVPWLHVQYQRPRTPLHDEAVWRISVASPGLEHVFADLDPRALPTAPVELRLPPVGTIAVRRVVGGRALVPRQLGLRLAKDAVNRDLHEYAHQRDADADGWTWFRAVPLGEQFVVVAAAASAPFAGPTNDGEVVRHEFAHTGDEIVLLGRVVDERGAALSSVDVSARSSIRHRRGVGDEVSALRTDDDGRVAFVMSAYSTDELTLERMTLSVGTSIDSVRMHDVAPRALPTQVTDLGELRLTPPPTVVAGRFVFDAGVAPFEVGCRVESHVAQREHEFDDEWLELQWLARRQDADGRFAFLGNAPPGRYRLRVIGTRHLPIEPIEFTPGARDVVVRVRTGAPLSATVWLPSNAPPDADDVRGVLRDASGATVVGVAHRLPPENGIVARREIVWPAVAPGRYTLTVGLRGYTEPVVTIPFFDVPAPANGDPRLRAIDLRERVDVVTLRAEPTTVPTFAFPIPRDPAAANDAYRFVDGRCTLLVPRAGARLVVQRHDRALVELRDPRGEVEVTFTPWSEVELRFEGLAPMPEGTVVFAHFANTDFDGDGRVVLEEGVSTWSPLTSDRTRLPIGSHSRLLHVLLARSGQFDPILITTQRIAPSPTPVVVRVPASAWQRAVAELERQRGGPR